MTMKIVEIILMNHTQGRIIIERIEDIIEVQEISGWMKKIIKEMKIKIERICLVKRELSMIEELRILKMRIE